MFFLLLVSILQPGTLVKAGVPTLEPNFVETGNVKISFLSSAVPIKI